MHSEDLRSRENRKKELEKIHRQGRVASTRRRSLDHIAPIIAFSNSRGFPNPKAFGNLEDLFHQRFSVPKSSRVDREKKKKAKKQIRIHSQRYLCRSVFN